MSLTIKKMQPKDWSEVARIYKQGIDTGIATFEKNIPSWEYWDKAHIQQCRLIAIEDNNIVGWAALSPVSSRCVYGGVAEVSVYVAVGHHGNGIGFMLLQQLIIESEAEGFWTLQSGIFPQNIASIQLHKKAGFREMGYREKIGKMDGKWFNNVLMERRSNIVGID